MLKGYSGVSKQQPQFASNSMVGTSETALLEPVEKTKKKLSFREPEIMGYYMQMKQGVTNRLSKRMKSTKNGKKPAPNATTKSCIYKNCANDDRDMYCNDFGGSTEDLDLEVGFWDPQCGRQ